jgi:serine/threonine-protein kinase
VASIETINLDNLIGREVGTSTLVKELARGASAVVFVAYQRTLKRQIAVKLLPRSLLNPFAVECFRQEAEASAFLSHPNIISVYEAGETEDFLFIAMQLVKGRSVLDLIKMARNYVLPSRRFLPIKTTIEITGRVLDALDYAHREGIVHRDIKPANVLIETHTKRPLIADFGIATTTRAQQQDLSKIAGTPTYMASEQILNKPVDGRVDIYAVGTVLFEMLVTNLPMPRCRSMGELFQQRLHLKERFFKKKPSELNPMLHRDMDEIVFRALAHDPDKRYATCGEFREALEAYWDNHMKK